MLKPSSVCCWYLPFSCQIIEGTKFICFLELFRLIYVSLSALIYGLRFFSFPMLGYFLTCNPHTVTLFLFYLTILAYRSFSALNCKSITNWPVLQKYYRSKLLIIIFWAVGYSIFMFVCWVIGIPDPYQPENTIPIALGIMLDLYFTYSVYSCYQLGIRGKFRIRPKLGFNPIENFTVRKAEYAIGQNSSVSEVVKEITAFPENTFLNSQVIENRVKINDLTFRGKEEIEEIRLNA